jgi:hypothetical protein
MKKATMLVLLFQITFLLVCVAQSNAHILELNPQKLGRIQTSNIVIDSIIDNRANKANFGVVMKGLSNKRLPVALNHDIEGLKNYLNQSIRHDEKSTHLVLVLNNFWISEQLVGMKEIATDELELLFCKRDSTNKLMIIGEYSNETEQTSGFSDLTSQHPTLMKKLFDEAFGNLTEEKMNTIGNHFFETTSIVKSAISIYQKDSIKSGFYTRFDDFYNDTPTPLTNIEIKSVALHSNIFKVIDKKTGKKLRRYYGFFDGQDVYLNSSSYGQMHSNYYNKVICFGRYMLVDDIYIDPLVSAVGAGFGLLGAIVASTTMQEGMLVDMKTGVPIILSNKNFLKILEPHPDLLKKYNALPSGSKGFEVKKVFIDSVNKLETN